MPERFPEWLRQELSSRPGRLAQAHHDLRGRLNPVMGACQIALRRLQARLTEQELAGLRQMDDNLVSFLELMDSFFEQERELATGCSAQLAEETELFQAPAIVSTIETLEFEVLGEGPCVLTIDDDLSVLEMLRSWLPDSGFSVLATNSAQRGLELALAQAPDVILLDMVMPHLDGLAALRALREHEQTRSIPVVVWSGLYEKPEITQKLDVRAWLTKPFDLEQLDSILRGAISG